MMKTIAMRLTKNQRLHLADPEDTCDNVNHPVRTLIQRNKLERSSYAMLNVGTSYLFKNAS